jgi:hypothetical protein
VLASPRMWGSDMKALGGLAGMAAGAAAWVIAGAAASQEFGGVYTFQTDDLAPGPEVQVLSGLLLAESDDFGGYEVMVIATDLYQDAAGQSRRIHARQSCNAEFDGSQVLVECQVEASDGENYQPDNFVLQPGANGVWAGQLLSAVSGGVELYPVF